MSTLTAPSSVVSEPPSAGVTTVCSTPVTGVGRTGVGSGGFTGADVGSGVAAGGLMVTLAYLTTSGTLAWDITTVMVALVAPDEGVNEAVAPVVGETEPSVALQAYVTPANPGRS